MHHNENDLYTNEEDVATIGKYAKCNIKHSLIKNYSLKSTKNNMDSQNSSFIVALDLDNTLVYTTDNPFTDFDFTVTCESDDSPITLYVNKRPAVDAFLAALTAFCKIVLFTASEKEYADQIIDFLDPCDNIFSKRYYRESCIQENGVYKKDLTKVTSHLSRIVLVDDSELAFANRENGIKITPYVGQSGTQELLNLAEYLHRISTYSDVRAAINV